MKISTSWKITGKIFQENERHERDDDMYDLGLENDIWAKRGVARKRELLNLARGRQWGIRKTRLYNQVLKTTLVLVTRKMGNNKSYF
jgi:hypothetical protein